MNDGEISVIEWAQKDSMQLGAIAFKKWCDDNEHKINRLKEHKHTLEELYKLFKKYNP